MAGFRTQGYKLQTADLVNIKRLCLLWFVWFIREIESTSVPGVSLPYLPHFFFYFSLAQAVFSKQILGRVIKEIEAVKAGLAATASVTHTILFGLDLGMSGGKQ